MSLILYFCRHKYWFSKRAKNGWSNGKQLDDLQRIPL